MRWIRRAEEWSGFPLRWFGARLLVAAGIAIMAGILVAVTVVTAHHYSGARPLVDDVEPTSHTGEDDLGPARWKWGTICIEDRTGWRWRWVVKDVAASFNTHTDLAVLRKRGAGACDDYKQVVVARGYWGGKNGVPGYAAMSWYTEGDEGFFTPEQAIYLNAAYWKQSSWRQRRHIASHEMGHVFGLGHNDRTDSVMGGPEQVWLSRYDRDHLHGLYPW